MLKYIVGLTAVVTLAIAGTATAKELTLIKSIPIQGEKLGSFDVGYVDQTTHRYYLADRSNKGIDIVNTKTDEWVGNVSGFIGAVVDEKHPKPQHPDSKKSGPNGVIGAGDEVWAGDGAGKIQVVDYKQMKIVDTIDTGGKYRTDSVTYDPKNMVFLAGNPNDEPTFLTLVSMKDRKIIKKIDVPEATDGLEEPKYNPRDGMFYVSVPELNKDKKKGGVAVVDPKAAKIVKMIHIDGCNPHGLAFGPDDHFVLGCSLRGKDFNVSIMSAKTGKLVARIKGFGGADAVAYDKKNNQYYIAADHAPGGAALGVIDAKTNKLVQKIPMKGNSTPHSVAADDENGHVYVPGGAFDGGCNCIQVFAVK